MVESTVMLIQLKVQRKQKRKGGTKKIGCFRKELEATLKFEENGKEVVHPKLKLEL